MPNTTVNRRRDAGFTIIELLVAITILSVLLGYGVPAFNEMVRNNRTSAQANELITSLNLARSEASKRGLPVSVCASNAAQSACEGDDVNEWTNGWLVFTDQSGAVGTFDGTDALVESSRAVADRMTLTSGNVGFVRFGANGAPTAAMAFEVAHEDCTGDNLRRISINAVGRISVVRDACT